MTLSLVKPADADDVREARARVDRIREAGQYVERWVAEVMEAYRRREWRTLGYNSWSEYVTAEFDALPRLTKDERAVIVGTMTDAGMNKRATAKALGVSDSTIKRSGSNEPLSESKSLATESPSSQTLVAVEEPIIVWRPIEGMSPQAYARTTHHAVTKAVQSVESVDKVVAELGYRNDGTLDLDSSADLLARLDAAMRQANALRRYLKTHIEKRGVLQ